MTVQRFYQSALWLPLVVPATIIAGWMVFGTTSAFRVLQNIAVIIVGSLVFGGVPYSILAIWRVDHST